MCGIVGYIGNNAPKHTVHVLEKLEYRGYDSCGFSTILNNILIVEKTQGRVQNIKEVANKYLDGYISIAHTRWATNGRPNKLNAHPHVAGNIALVHNGIIENYRKLKEQLNSEYTRTTISDTDTEIIAHLIDVSKGDCLFDKVLAAVKELKGSYALAIISEDEPDTIVVARKYSPLVVGIFDEGAIVASDIHAILPYTNRVHVLDDDEIAIVKRNYISICKLDGATINREPLEIAWSVAQSSKGDANTFMEKEIHEQPIAIYDTMMNNNWEMIAEKIYGIFDANTITNVTLVACGTSLHAGMVGSMMIEGISNIRTCAKLASEISSSAAIINTNDMVIAISQSGETADTIQAIRYAKQKGATVIAIVNTRGSSIENISDYTIHMAAGPEISVASTKAFSSQLVVLAMVTIILRACVLGSEQATGQFVSTQNEIYRCADCLSRIFDQKSAIKRIAQSISSAKSVLYLGRGLNVPTALEGALKLKEISYIHAEGFAAGEMKHGSIALIEDGTPVVVIVTKDQAYKKMLLSIEEAKSRGARIIAVATEGDEEIKKIVNDVIYIPDVGEIFTPMMATVPLQLLAMYTAEALGTDIDKPRNLAKSVSVE